MDRKRIKGLLQRFAEQNLLVIGDVMLDRYVVGTVDRISPEAPVPIVRVNREEAVPGGAANVAANIARLGSGVTLIGYVGDDFYGNQLVTEIKKMGVSPKSLLLDPKSQTIVKTRVIGNHQQIVRIDREDRQPTYALLEHKALLHLKNLLKKGNITGILISDYAKGTVTGPIIDFLVKRAQELNIFVSVDPKLKNFPLYRKVGIITPNNSEASQATGLYLDSEEKFLTAGRTLLQRSQSEAILITRGADGMQLFQKSGQVDHIPTKALKVYDVTGAGDSVIATFSLAKAAGATLLEAAEISNYAAGYVVGIPGTATCSRDNLLEFHDESHKQAGNNEFD